MYEFDLADGYLALSMFQDTGLTAPFKKRT